MLKLIYKKYSNKKVDMVIILIMEKPSRINKKDENKIIPRNNLKTFLKW